MLMSDDPRKLWGYWTESHQIYTQCREIIVLEIGIVTFQSILECQSDE